MDKRCVGGKAFCGDFPFLRVSFCSTFISILTENKLTTQARRKGSSVRKLPTDRPDIKVLTYCCRTHDAEVKPTDELLKLEDDRGAVCAAQYG